MEAVIGALSSAKCTDDIEAAISSSSALNLANCFSNDAAGESMKESLKLVLEKVLDNAEISTTAKLRRRIKRFQQSLDTVTIPTESDIVKQPGVTNYTSAVSVPHLNPDESIAALLACRSHHDLAREMNNLYTPGKEEGGVRGSSFSEHRSPMKNVLKFLVAQAGMTDKALRRRINRLIFALSTESEQAQEVAAVKAKAQMVATRNLTVKKVHALPKETVVNTPVITPLLSKFEAARFITDCISGIRSAKTSSDVERVISALPANGFGDSEILRDLLTSLLDNSDLVNNAKVRRRVKRLIETLLASGAATDVPLPNSVSEINCPIASEAPSSSSVSVPRIGEVKVYQRAPPLLPLRIPSAAAATATVVSPPDIRVITGSFMRSLIELQNAVTSSDVEAAISELSADSEGDEVARESVRERLEEIFKNEQLINNSKLRRRVKRLIEVLAPPNSTAPSEITPIFSSEVIAFLDPNHNVKKEKVKKEKVKKEDLCNPPAGNPLGDLILLASAAKTSEELSAVFLTVTAESGNCATRRTLKRMLERVLKDDSQLSRDMTAQMRRKFRRTADMMSPRPAVSIVAAASIVDDVLKVEK